MSKSKWSYLDHKIEKVIRKNPNRGYTQIAQDALPDGRYADYDTLRTYIRRNFGSLRDSLMEEPLEKTPVKVLVYDLETSRVKAKVWWTGKQYVSYKQLLGETKIISVSWKFIGEDKVHSLSWDKDHSDEKLLREFMPIYNSADKVIGFNSHNFDDRLLNARAAKYDLPINTFVKSFDIMKQAKRLFRLQSYSMDYMTEFFGLTNKLQTEGIVMWDKIEDGTPQEQREYLKKMIDYNIGDIISTEDLYLKLRKYMKNRVHLGVLDGKERFTCPEDGSDNLKLIKTTATEAGTVQRVMECQDCGCVFKLSNSNYVKYLDHKMQKELEEIV